jgi:hypothetical protein
MRVTRWKSNFLAFGDCPHLTPGRYSSLAGHHVDGFLLLGMVLFHREVDTAALVFEAGVRSVE